MGSRPDPVTRFTASPSVALWILLESCERFGMEPPKSTGHISTTEELCRYISEVELSVDGQPLAQDIVDRAFMGQPVKATYHLVRRWAAKIDDLMERDLALRRYADKRFDRLRAKGEVIPWRDQLQRGPSRPANHKAG